MTGRFLAALTLPHTPFLPWLKNNTELISSYGLNGDSYTIHFFLGPVDGKPSRYGQHPNHIESVYTFSSRLEPAADSQAEAGGEEEAKPKCDNCQKQKASGVLSKGQIHLTSALLKVAMDPEKPELDCLEPEEVNQYLQRNLTWRVVDVGSHLFPRASPPTTASTPNIRSLWY